MTVKEKIVRQSIDECKKRIAELREIIFGNPLSQICELRIKANEILVENAEDCVKIAELLEPLAKKEKELFKLAEKQKDSVKLTEELSEKECELGDLINELYSIERKKQRPY